MKSKKWVATLGIGLLGNWAMTWAFDFVLYPFVIAKYGLILGTPLLTILSFIICYATILFYDYSKKDWLGIETLKSLKEFIPRPLPKNIIGKLIVSIINWIGKYSAWLMKKSDVVLMILLSIRFDPFITVVHIRHGAHQFNGLSKRDWKVFMTSLIIGNAYWALAVYMGISIVEIIWMMIKK